ncbi:VOC family protein [Hymenobacter terrenus]|uniref:VOC family protein n=1 Tax=Hymenobacter terrenus TaxID=1629124 RepID=UPI00061953B7|nr:VOC family protein [Hymenobacter terrenus]
MYLTHIALWTPDLERSCAFYTTFFGAVAGPRYHNPIREFTSYFLSFASGARLELMHQPALPVAAGSHLGYAHLAFATGSPAQVNHLTERLRAAGYSVIGEPRTTGDGYYESVVADPDGNLLELTV